MKIELAKNEIIHFIGIGGIGMNGLSLIMKGKGFKVQGSDIASNKNIERLKKEKIKIFIGHKKQHIKNATIVVISSAIKKSNPELIEAKKKKFTNNKERKNVGPYSFVDEKYSGSRISWKNYHHLTYCFNFSKNQSRSNNN